MQMNERARISCNFVDSERDLTSEHEWFGRQDPLQQRCHLNQNDNQDRGKRYIIVGILPNILP
jgi:hypothetical protein